MGMGIPVELYIPAEASLDEALSILGIEKATHRGVGGGSGHEQPGWPRMD